METLAYEKGLDTVLILIELVGSSKVSKQEL